MTPKSSDIEFYDPNITVGFSDPQIFPFSQKVTIDALKYDKDFRPSADEAVFRLRTRNASKRPITAAPQAGSVALRAALQLAQTHHPDCWIS